MTRNANYIYQIYVDYKYHGKSYVYELLYSSHGSLFAIADGLRFVDHQKNSDLFQEVIEIKIQEAPIATIDEEGRVAQSVLPPFYLWRKDIGAVTDVRLEPTEEVSG